LFTVNVLSTYRKVARCEATRPHVCLQATNVRRHVGSR